MPISADKPLGALSLDDLVLAALAEDIGDGDRTTQGTVSEDETGTARVLAKAHGVISGRRPFDRVFEHLEPAVALEWGVADGDRVSPGDLVVELHGSMRTILMGERTALNFLGRLSGIATLAARYVEAVQGTHARIVDTRKTTPGWRELEKGAVLAGGALNHRFGLFDMVLVKENHIRAAGGVSAALRAVQGEAAREDLEVEVEVATLEELEEALTVTPDRVLLDNMSVEDLRKAVAVAEEHSPPRPLLEASGGVRLDTVRAIAETGVDLISVGALTHSAPALDLSLLVVE
jgi:nicotinate-nucleotide pyrophosphorylase (carboxylating)